MSDTTPPAPLTANIPDAKRRLLQRTDEVAARIAALMHEQKLTQTDLARKAGKPKSYVSRVLSGAVNLTLKTVAEFEAALGADVVTVPAWEPPYPRRRRSAPAQAVTKPSTPESLEAGLPTSLRDRLQAFAEQEGTTVPALLTLWASERLATETAAALVLHSALGLDRVDFAQSLQVTLHVPTGYASSPLWHARTPRQQTCVDPSGQLVPAGDYSPYDPDDSGR